MPDRYDAGIDLWACGCIFGQILLHAPLFPGTSDIDQVYRIAHALGPPKVEDWPEFPDLPDSQKVTIPDFSPMLLPNVDVPHGAHALLARFLTSTQPVVVVLIAEQRVGVHSNLRVLLMCSQVRLIKFGRL